MPKRQSFAWLEQVMMSGRHATKANYLLGWLAVVPAWYVSVISMLGIQSVIITSLDTNFCRDIGKAWEPLHCKPEWIASLFTDMWPLTSFPFFGIGAFLAVVFASGCAPSRKIVVAWISYIAANGFYIWLIYGSVGRYPYENDYSSGWRFVLSFITPLIASLGLGLAGIFSVRRRLERHNLFPLTYQAGTHW